MSEPVQEHDDLSAIRRVIDILQPFSSDAQRRILRWASEKLCTGDLDGRSLGYDVNRESGEDLAAYTAVLKKSASSNDRIFAAAVAFAEQSCAPQGFRKDHVTAESLRAAAARVRRDGPKYPAQTLINAEGDGLLKKIGRGRYVLTPKGRKAVARSAASRSTGGRP
jgi:hypothetical protein